MAAVLHDNTSLLQHWEKHGAQHQADDDRHAADVKLQMFSYFCMLVRFCDDQG
jgi:hypothetical protein